jgi:hypothetical protein
MRHSLLPAAALALATGAAHSAAIIIDDRDPERVTVTATDIETAVFIDDFPIFAGLGGSASTTRPDGLFNLSGTLGIADLPSVTSFLLTFGPVVGGAEVTSRVGLLLTDRGASVTFSGGVGSLTGTPYAGDGPALFALDGGPQSLSLPGLLVTFIPEASVAPVPGPAAAALFGLGLLGLAALRRH